MFALNQLAKTIKDICNMNTSIHIYHFMLKPVFPPSNSPCFSSGLYSQSYLHPPKISLLPPPEVTRVRCLVNQDKKPRPLQRKPTFLMKLRGKDGGKKEEPLRNAAYFTWINGSGLLLLQQPSKSIVFNPLLKYEHLPQEVASARNFLQQQWLWAHG